MSPYLLDGQKPAEMHLLQMLQSPADATIDK